MGTSEELENSNSERGSRKYSPYLLKLVRVSSGRPQDHKVPRYRRRPITIIQYSLKLPHPAATSLLIGTFILLQPLAYLSADPS
jgi:hypothetical protein